MKNKSMQEILKYISISILLIFGHNLFSQNEESNNKYSIGIVFTPQFSNWKYKTSPEYQWFVDLADSIYIEKNGFSFGIISEYKINNKFDLDFGVVSSYYPYETIILTNNLPNQDPLLPCGRGSFSGSDHFIDIPISLKYNLINRNRVTLFVGIGIVNKFLLFERVKSFSECYNNKELISKSCKIVDFFNYYISGSLKAGIDISITDKISTGFYPSFEYSLFNIKKDREITRHYNLVGININMLYKL